MGEAKRRGTLQDRMNDPKGDTWNTWNETYWTEERLTAFKESMRIEINENLTKIRKSLFTSRKKKTKRFRKIATGG